MGWAVAGPSDFLSLLPPFSVLILLPPPCSAPTTESGLRCPCVGRCEVKGVGEPQEANDHLQKQGWADGHEVLEAQGSLTKGRLTMSTQ